MIYHVTSQIIYIHKLQYGFVIKLLTLGGGKQKVSETEDNTLKTFYQSQQEVKQYWTRYQSGMYAYEAKLFLRIKNANWKGSGLFGGRYTGLF